MYFQESTKNYHDIHSKRVLPVLLIQETSLAQCNLPSLYPPPYTNSKEPAFLVLLHFVCLEALTCGKTFCRNKLTYVRNLAPCSLPPFCWDFTPSHFIPSHSLNKGHILWPQGVHTCFSFLQSFPRIFALLISFAQMPSSQ